MTEAVPLIQTKLYRPPIQAGIIPRPRLVERLNVHWQDRPLTLISAPAGFGKSVLASMWLESCDSPSGWVSLDESDNDLRTFTTYLLAAVKGAFPDISFHSQALLETPIPPPTLVLARYLVNDLDQIEKPFILALDDIHVIHEQAILDLLAELLKHPPRAMQLVLIGRQDPAIPVASLRAYQLFAEIRMKDLRFTSRETAELLKQISHRDIDEDLAAKWTQRTEGWVTALYLAALSLAYHQETTDLETNVRGDSHYLQEYLLAEVIASIPPFKQTWLLKTSLLDRFCAPLCEVVCQEEGEESETSHLTGKTFIQWLRQANLFLIELDDQGEWFRFHHLFQNYLQDLLKGQLRQEEIATLHQQASRWFKNNGWTDEAIQHALVAEDMPAALELVTQHRHSLMNKDHWHRIERWLESFPVQVKSNDPMLTLTRAHLDIVRGRPDELVSYLDRAQTLVASMPDDLGLAAELAGELASFTAFANVMLGQAAMAVENAAKALSLLPRQALHVRTMSLGSLGIGHQMSGKIDQDAAIYKDALANPGWPSNVRAKLLVFRSVAHFIEGDLAGTQLLAGESLQLVGKNSLTTPANFARYFLGIVHYLRNELAQAEPFLLTQLNDMALSSPGPLAYATCALASIYSARQQTEKASEVLQLVGGYFDAINDPVAIKTLRAFQIELALEQGDFDRARHLGQFVDYDPRPPTWYHYIPQLTPIKLLLAEKTAPDLENALQALEQFDRQMLKIHRNTIRIEVLALQALAHDARGDRQMANEKLLATLRLAEPGGFIRTFVDLGPPMADLLARLQEQGGTEMEPYISRILAAFRMEAQRPAAPAPVGKPKLERPLTERELQTLRLLATDLSPQEIASEMTVSITTMRTHARNIYQKLRVNSRFEAVQQAKDLNLL